MTFAYSVTKERNVVNVSPERVFKLSPIAESVMTSRKRPMSSTHLFQGDKQLHAVQDAGLWHLVYKSSDGTGAGALPEQLKQRWTSFNQLLKYLIIYFENRGVKIEEISNAPTV